MMFIRSPPKEGPEQRDGLFSSSALSDFVKVLVFCNGSWELRVERGVPVGRFVRPLASSWPYPACPHSFSSTTFFFFLTK